MKTRSIILISVGSLLMTVTVLSVAHSGAVRMQSATQAATSNSPTTQCGYLDLLAFGIAATPGAMTPGATQSATQAASSGAQNPISPTPTASEINVGEAGGGDAALTTYRVTGHHFSIDYPQSWSQEGTFKSGVCFTGRDASIAVQTSISPFPPI